MAQEQLNYATDVLRGIDSTLRQLKGAINSQEVNSRISPYHGDAKGFRIWIKEVEKLCTLLNLGDADKKAVAYQSSRGGVSDFLKRRGEEFPEDTWVQVKTELARRFAEITDGQHAFTVLKSVKQKSGESVQMYSEKLIALAEDAFVGQDMSNDCIDKLLIGFFVDGLQHNSLKFKLLRENPSTLGAAIETALKEENLMRRYQLRIGREDDHRFSTVDHEEPMEVDQLRPARRRQDTQPHPRPVDYHDRRRVNAVSSAPLLRFNCGGPGHFARNCNFNTRGQYNTQDSRPSNRGNGRRGNARSFYPGNGGPGRV
ncbi:hypothetical protein BsWGS_03747 [Bradybaena similaris]